MAELDYIQAQNITHVPKSGRTQDIHFVSERQYYKDGDVKPHIRKVKYQRTFYVSQQNHREYTQKKEREEISKLVEFKCTQSELPTKVAHALGMRSGRGLRQYAISPYLYGTDIHSSILLANDYLEKWDNDLVPRRYLAYDLETDVNWGTGEIIISSLAMDDKVTVVIARKFLGDLPNPVEKLHKVHTRLIKDYGYSKYMKDIKMEYEVVESELAVIERTAEIMTLWDPDVVSAWNHDFDVNKLVERCGANKVRMEDIFTHPDIPKPYRRFKFLEGRRGITSVDGDYRPLDPSEQWHSVYSTTFYTWEDAMCTYRRLRSQEQSLGSYSLGAIATSLVGVGKLELPETEKMTNLERHEYMQHKKKLEYCVYGGLDPRLMILMENETKDMTLRYPTEKGFNNHAAFGKPTMTTANRFYMFCKERGFILGSVPGQAEEFEYEVLPLSGWPLTVPNNMISELGCRCLKQYPHYRTTIYINNATRDVVSSYPSLISVMNPSKETTEFEVIKVLHTGLDKMEIRNQCLNLVNGQTNSVAYMSNLFGWPTLTDVDTYIDRII